MRSSTVFSAVLSLALLSNEVLATPPACLLACVAQVTKSSSSCNALNDVACICSKEGSSVKSCLDSICPNGNADAAYSAFESSCSEQNAFIGQTSSSSSASSSSSSSIVPSSSSSSSSSSIVPSSSSTTVVETASSEITTSSAVTSTFSTSTSISSTSTTAATSTISTSSSTSTVAVSDIQSDAGNFLQAGNSFVVAAVAALLI